MSLGRARLKSKREVKWKLTGFLKNTDKMYENYQNWLDDMMDSRYDCLLGSISAVSRGDECGLIFTCL